MQKGQISAVIIVIAVICLAVGLVIGYGMYSGKTVTTSIVQTSTLIETQTTKAVESVNVTVTPYCCTDAKLNNATPCGTILTQNYPPVQRLQYLIETDPNFIAAEQGLNYVANGGMGCGDASDNSIYNGTTVDFFFTYTSDRLYTDNCGYVENFTYYLHVLVPLMETGYNMSAIKITSINSSEITVSCTTSYSSTANSTVTVTATTST